MIFNPNGTDIGISGLNMGLRVKPGLQIDIPTIDEQMWERLKEQAHSDPDAAIESCKKQVELTQGQFFAAMINQMNDLNERLTKISESSEQSAKAAALQAESSAKSASAAESMAKSSDQSDAAAEASAKDSARQTKICISLTVMSLIVSVFGVVAQYLQLF